MQQAALVFDLDGTLVDSLPDLRAALNETLRGRARRELSADEVRRMIGDGTHALASARCVQPAKLSILKTRISGFSISTKRRPHD
jgi:phosphoglycolate phosphatase